MKTVATEIRILHDEENPGMWEYQLFGEDGLIFFENNFTTAGHAFDAAVFVERYNYSLGVSE